MNSKPVIDPALIPGAIDRLLVKMDELGWPARLVFQPPNERVRSLQAAANITTEQLDFVLDIMEGEQLIEAQPPFTVTITKTFVLDTPGKEKLDGLRPVDKRA